jgi:hypothetical protein
MRRDRVSLKVTVAAALAAAGGACTIGEGKGEVTGTLFVSQCDEDDKTGQIVDLDCGPHNAGDTTKCQLFNLGTTFFVGEPIDAPSKLSSNLLLIRAQNGGARLEFADAMVFYLVDLYEVGRCMSGRMDPATGQPDWNPALCDRPADGSGTGRMLIGTESEVVRAHLLLNHSCDLERVCPTCPTVPPVGDALGQCTDGTCPAVTLCPGRGSWITFGQLGGLVENARVPVNRSDFKVNYGERVFGSEFQVELCDARTVDAVQERTFPVPAPRMVGSLNGFLDFTLERGQAGQPFP